MTRKFKSGEIVICTKTFEKLVEECAGTSHKELNEHYKMFYNKPLKVIDCYSGTCIVANEHEYTAALPLKDLKYYNPLDEVF